MFFSAKEHLTQQPCKLRFPRYSVFPPEAIRTTTFHTDSIQARLPPCVMRYCTVGISQEASETLLVTFGTREEQTPLTMATLQFPRGGTVEVTQVSLERFRSKKL